MKKFVALLLAVMMVLACVSAFAAGSKESTPVVVKKTEPAPTAYIIPVADGTNGAEFKQKIADGATINDLYTEDTVPQITALVGETNVMHELVCLEVIDAWTPEIGAQSVEFEFASQYKAGDAVAAVLSVFDANGVTEYVLDAKVTADYVITISFPTDLIEKMQAATENVLVIVSQQ